MSPIWLEPQLRLLRVPSGRRENLLLQLSTSSSTLSTAVVCIFDTQVLKCVCGHMVVQHVRMRCYFCCSPAQCVWRVLHGRAISWYTVVLSIIYIKLVPTFVCGHTRGNTLYLIRTAKLSPLRHAQYSGGGPRGNRMCCRLFLPRFLLPSLIICMLVHVQLPHKCESGR